MSDKDVEIPEEVRKKLHGEGKEEKEEKEEKKQKKAKEEETYTCPKCGKDVPYFMVYGESYTPVCENCGSPVKKENIPEESLIKVPSKEQQREMKKAIEEGRSISERSKEEKTGRKGFYKQPRKPHEVLEDLLRDWDFDEPDIRRLVSHSKRVGGIHPVELRNKLTQMKGGLGNTADASMFAREYAEELRKEQQKAQRLNSRINYPIENYRQGPGTRRGQTSGTGGQNVRQGGDEIDKALRILDKFQTMRNRSGGGNDKYLTKQEFQNMMLEQRNDQLQQQIQGLRQQINSLIENQSSQPAPSGEYRDDWFRLIHDSTMALKDVIDKKEPVKLVVKSLAEQPPMEERPKARETSRSRSNVPNMIDKRYVAPQQRSQQQTTGRRRKPQQRAKRRSSKGRERRKENIKKRKPKQKKE